MAGVKEAQHMTSNEEAVRDAYAIAEAKDIRGWIDCFVPDGVFVDNSVEVTYRGPDVSKPVEYYGAAFSDMHRELYDVYVSGDVFTLADGKIERFDCYPEGSVILSQLGVLSNLGAVLEPLPE